MPQHYIRKSKSNIVRGPSGIGFTLTKEGNYDMENRQLVNVGEPIDLTAAVNKKYVDDKIIIDSSENNMLIKNNDGSLKVPKCLILDEHYDAENKKIIHLKNPNKPNDAVNKKYVDEYTAIDRSMNNLLIRTEDGLLVTDENLIKENNNLFDCKEKRLINVKYPEEDNDAVNKQYVDIIANAIKLYINKKFNEFLLIVVDMLKKLDKPTEADDMNKKVEIPKEIEDIDVKTEGIDETDDMLKIMNDKGILETSL